VDHDLQVIAVVSPLNPARGPPLERCLPQRATPDSERNREEHEESRNGGHLPERALVALVPDPQVRPEGQPKPDDTFVAQDRDNYFTRNRFVNVHRICHRVVGSSDDGEREEGETEGWADPVQAVLNPNPVEDEREGGEDDVWAGGRGSGQQSIFERGQQGLRGCLLDCWQAVLGLANPVVSASGTHRNPVAKVPARRNTEQATDKATDEAKRGLQNVEVVRRA